MHRGHPNKHGKFRKECLVHLKDLEGILQQRQAAMSNEWSSLDKGWAELEQKMKEVGMSMSSLDTPDPVLLNVGGSDAHIPRFILDGMKGSSAAWTVGDLFGGGEWDGRLPRDPDGQVFLDESPVCFQHLIHKMATSLGKPGACPDLGAKCLPRDELRYLSYAAGVLGLPSGMTLTGGSSILTADEADELTATILDWCPGDARGLELLYRASRDGCKVQAFLANIDHASSTISLVRVKAASSDTCDSVVGGFSSVPWGTMTSGAYVPSPGAFLFMLRDGSAKKPDTFLPVKWGSKDGSTTSKVFRSETYALGFGDGPCDFLVSWERSPSTFQAGNRSFGIPAESSYLKLNRRAVAEVEVYRVCYDDTAPPTTESAALQPTPPATAGEGLIDCATIFGAGTTILSPEEHEDDVHRFGASIAESLRHERIALHHAQSELVRANGRATASVQALGALYGPDVAKGEKDPIIEFSVRGNRSTKWMTTLLSTIHACPPESVLAVRFERWSKNDSDKDSGGRWQINDCSPPVFAKLLDVLRMKKRAGWDGGDGSQGRGGGRPVRVSVKSSDRSSFEKLVNMYFPGCESFVMDSVEFQTGSPVP